MARILTREELSLRIRAEKAEGKTVVLANGAFDILHVGHIRYLRGAAELGEVLVVALNSDASVGAAKGRGRPILPLRERMELVAAVEGVDYVVSFDEKKVSRLLLEIKPQVHAKGADYTRETVPEREEVLSYGGKVAIAGDAKEHDTTAIIAKVLAAGQ